jgi:hypothetical protein
MVLGRYYLTSVLLQFDTFKYFRANGIGIKITVASHENTELQLYSSNFEFLDRFKWVMIDFSIIILFGLYSLFFYQIFARECLPIRSVAMLGERLPPTRKISSLLTSVLSSKFIANK